MWEDHDGASFGHQNITDGLLGIETDWINHEHSWRARVSIDGAKNNTHAFIFYLAAQDLETRLEPLHQFDKSTWTYTVLRGKSSLFGEFQLELKMLDKVSTDDLSRMDFDGGRSGSGGRMLDMTLVTNILMYSLRRKPNGELVILDFQEHKSGDGPDLVAVQINVAGRLCTHF